MKLTEKQENFALEYVLNGGDASKAYRTCYDVGEDTQPSYYLEGCIQDSIRYPMLSQG